MYRSLQRTGVECGETSLLPLLCAPEPVETRVSSGMSSDKAKNEYMSAVSHTYKMNRKCCVLYLQIQPVTFMFVPIVFTLLCNVHTLHSKSDC